MNQENIKVIETLKKLLARAEGNANENEARVCIMKAQKLMAEHNINMSEINIKNEKEDIIKDGVGSAGRTSWWEKQLSTIIAKNFKVYNFITYKGNGTQVIFMGRKTDVEIAKISFEFTESAMKRIVKDYVYKHGGGVGTKNDYIKGFLQGLQAQFTEQVDKNKWGLVLVIDRDVTNQYNQMRLKKGQSSGHRTNHDRDAVNSGYNTGKSFGVNRQAIN
jgi:hypothetical protein